MGRISSLASSSIYSFSTEDVVLEVVFTNFLGLQIKGGQFKHSNSLSKCQLINFLNLCETDIILPTRSRKSGKSQVSVLWLHLHSLTAHSRPKMQWTWAWCSSITLYGTSSTTQPVLSPSLTFTKTNNNSKITTMISGPIYWSKQQRAQRVCQLVFKLLDTTGRMRRSWEWCKQLKIRLASSQRHQNY